MRHQSRLFIILLIIVLAACTGTTDPTATRANTATPLPTNSPAPSNTPVPAPSSTPTSEPTLTPMVVENLPAIELVSGTAETCINAEAYGQVLGFEVIYYETTTDNHMVYTLYDADGNILTEDTTSGENRDGAGGWGFYPDAYAVTDNTALTLRLYVYTDVDSDTATSVSQLTYNCTTGATLSATFERN